MKKLIAVILTLALALSCASLAFAAQEVTPVVVVSGIGSNLYSTDGEGNTETLWPISADSIINAVLKAAPGLGFALLSDDFSKIDSALVGVKEMFEGIATDENGKAPEGLDTDHFTKSIDNYPDEFGTEWEKTERAICRAIGDKIGQNNVFFYTYIWSLSPMDLADELDTYIDGVLEQTGARKVSLVACSMGGTITMSYLYKYGTEKVKNIVLASTAFQGTEIVGQMFNKQVNISIYDVLKYFSEFTGVDLVQTLIAIVTKGIGSSDRDILGSFDGFIADLLKNLKGAAYSDVFLDTFVKMPGIWALMPVSYYESAKETLFADSEPYAFLTDLDEYMYSVQSNAKLIIDKCIRSSSPVYITCSYLTSGIPVVEDTSAYTDNLIDLKYASGGAVVAPVGGELPTTDLPACGNKSHNHFSEDGVINAGTCMLPEQTWFIKNMGHMDYAYGDATGDLIVWLSTSEEPVDIYTDSEFPQFMTYNVISHEVTDTVGSDDGISSASSWAQLLVSFINGLIKLIITLVKSFA